MTETGRPPPEESLVADYAQADTCGRRLRRGRTTPPRTAISLTLNLSSTGGNSPTVDETYVGVCTDATDAINVLPSHQLITVRAGLEGDRWSAVLFVNNATNKRAFLSDIVQDAIALPDYNRIALHDYKRIAVNQPLTVGIDLNYRFGGP